MNLLHEWPLVIFTLATQVAVGLVLALLVARIRLPADGAAIPEGGTAMPANGAPAASPWSHWPLLMVGVLTAVGLAGSLLHLGAPLNALRTLSNLGHSWLSREILAGLTFLGLWALTFHFHLRPAAAPPWMRHALALALALAGLLLLWTMARVYMMPARPVWDTWLTPASFLLTALILGAVAVAAYMERHPAPRPESWLPGFDSPSPAPAITASLNPGIDTPLSKPSLPAPANPGYTPSSPPLARPVGLLLALGLAAALAQLAVSSSHPVTEVLRTSGAGGNLANARILLLLAGAFFITAALAKDALVALGTGAPSGGGAGPGSGARPSSGEPSSTFNWSGLWTASALLLLLASETMGRILFYAMGTADPF